VFQRQVARVHAGTLRVLHERDERAHLIDGETEVSAAANEGQPLHIGIAIDALATRLPVRRAQQPDLFVVADRRRAGAGPFREGPNLEALHGADSLDVFSS
jgi:hypothetical protein